MIDFNLGDDLKFKILFLGDVVGRQGRKVLTLNLKDLISELKIDLVIANGENSSGGLGIDPRTAGEIFASGVDFITTGNHVWDKKEIRSYLNENSDRIIRPANFSEGAPGVGVATIKKGNLPSVAIFNLMGRVFMGDLLDCPFKKIGSLMENIEADFSFLDFHAETTSEKVSMGFHVDGRISMMVGTHTHVQTADLRFLPKGTAYITDAGMCGAYDSVIGMEVGPVLERFKTGLPARFEPAKGRAQINAVAFECCSEQKKVVSTERILRVYP